MVQMVHQDVPIQMLELLLLFRGMELHWLEIQRYLDFFPMLHHQIHQDH
jgi:hypothetical protein